MHRNGLWEWTLAPGVLPSPRYQHAAVSHRSSCLFFAILKVRWHSYMVLSYVLIENHEFESITPADLSNTVVNECRLAFYMTWVSFANVY